MGHEVNYSDEYNMYWSQRDHIGETSAELKRVANEILLGCGSGSILDVGSGEGVLVNELLDRGINAVGVDVSEVVVARSNSRTPGRFIHGSILALPFEDVAFESVTSINCLEYLVPDDIPAAFREIHRVAQKTVFLRVATAQSEIDHRLLTVEARSWWEAKCFDAGFRKHPAYYKINDYESLNRDDQQICILLEKLPQLAANAYPMGSLTAERGLQMDMLRNVGARSDAGLIRYHLASGYVRPRDRVLDVECGLGYGGRVIQANTRADKISGIDGSERAIEYAKKSFSNDRDHRVVYELGMLPDALLSFADGSVDLITSFETLEHVSDPVALLREFHRVLTPGGRILVSVQNHWSDESSEGPNPYHLHVYDWCRIKTEIEEFFTLEAAYAQTATRCKVPALGANVWERRGRLLRQVDIAESAPMDCEWWLMVGMKSPVESSSGYKERVFQNIAGTGHPSIRYGDFFSSPWLMHSMVNISHRLRGRKALGDLCLSVLKGFLPDSNDYKAALCVWAYLVLEQRDRSPQDVQDVIRLIDCAVGTDPLDKMALRWRISLLFVKGKLLQVLGELTLAIGAYGECASHDVRLFGVHLATKTTEACFLAGRIALSIGDAARAHGYWEQGVEIGNQLLGVSLDDILINRAYPNLFNHGDGVREYTVAWDNIARCANGLALLAEGHGVDEVLLQGCFQTEYAVVTRDVVSCRKRLDEVTLELAVGHQALKERTELVALSNAALEGVTRELVETRADLIERTTILEKYDAELLARTGELVSLRQELVELTDLLEGCGGELVRRTDELIMVRKELEGRTHLLEASNAEMAHRTHELVLARQDLVERTALLEGCDPELLSRSDAMLRTQQELVERTTLLENRNSEFLEVRQELVAARQQLVERTAILEDCSASLVDRTDDLVRTRQQLVERTAILEDCSAALVDRTDDLVRTTQQLAERTYLLTDASLELVRRTEMLERVSGDLVERTALLEQANRDLALSRSDVTRCTEQLLGAGEELKTCSSELLDAREALQENQKRLDMANEEILRLSRSMVRRIWRRMRRRGG